MKVLSCLFGNDATMDRVFYKIASQPPIMEDVDASLPFLGTWHTSLEYVLIGVAGLLPLGLLVYIITIKSISGLKKRYDFINKRESGVIKLGNILIGLGIFALCNLINKGQPQQGWIHFIVLLAIGLVAAVAYIYFSILFVDVYCSKLLVKRLRALRYKPRTNPKTGNTMTLLTEEEEDKYLDEGMQMEEKVFAVDYDVWIEKETGDTIVEKYEGNLIADTCSNCGFQTLRLIREESLEAEDDERLRIQQYRQCSYCKMETEEIVTKKKSSKQDTADELTSATQRDVRMIRVSITPKDGETAAYDFQNLQQAQDFLSEYSQRSESTTSQT